jgi:hypothetical protein
MNLQEVVSKASKNLRWQYDSGAGLQLYGDVPDPVTNHVEHKLRPGTQQIFTLVSGYRDGSYNPTPHPQSPNDIRVMFGYEKWVQFAPQGWDEMQKANAALMTHAAKHIAKLTEALRLQINLTEDVAGQQAMPDDFWAQDTEKNKQILANAETVS